jgi:ABC-type proline/glycine betaine transport system permease subunit
VICERPLIYKQTFFSVSHKQLILLQWMYNLASNFYQLCYSNPISRVPKSFCPNQIAGFIKFTAISFIMFIRLLKASNRFVTMYFPIHYQKWLTKKNTLHLILILAFLTIVIHLPLLLSKIFFLEISFVS